MHSAMNKAIPLIINVAVRLGMLIALILVVRHATSGRA